MVGHLFLCEETRNEPKAGPEKYVAAAWRAGTSSSGTVSAREVALTMMLVYNSIFFTVCVSPIALFRVVWPFIPEINPGRRHHNMFFAGLWVLDAMSYINATFNIVVYYSMGSRYRQTFWQLLGKANKKDHNRKKQSATTANIITAHSENN
ncbi:uncharacterized protein LOC143293991 [Babylonia areolata]|uniref:uncharacterized protein LOC143293991 n=1 Tax=Babylonia areolata TaxID=304850 RepID=UPI003FD160A9